MDYILLDLNKSLKGVITFSFSIIYDYIENVSYSQTTTWESISLTSSNFYIFIYKHHLKILKWIF